MGAERFNTMTCGQAQEALGLYLVRDPSLTAVDRRELETHLAACSECRRERDEQERLVALLRDRWGPISKGTRALLDACEGPHGVAVAMPNGAWRPMTVEEGWADLKRRIAAYEEQKKRERIARLGRVGRAGALAASLVLAVAAGWFALTGTRDERPSPLASRDGSAGVPNAVDEVPVAKRAGLSDEMGSHAGELLTTHGQPREVILEGMHRLVLDVNTSASVVRRERPSSAAGPRGSRLAYELSLSRGRIYLEVVPGSVFTVTTDNAVVRVTGTAFDVRTEPGLTELVLVRGSVRFGSSAPGGGWADIRAGHASRIVGRSAPEQPEQIDARAAVAWARDLALANAVARMAPAGELLMPIPGVWEKPPYRDLDMIDYRTWSENRRSWFVREFPWIAELEAAITDTNGAEADFLALLTLSGDVWQFHYPRSVARPIPAYRPGAIGCLSQRYNIDAAVLLRAVSGSARDALQGPGPTSADVPEPGGASPATTYLTALRHWRAAIAKAVGDAEPLSDDLMLFSLRAARYLGTTRTAVYLWMNEHPEEAARLVGDGRYADRWGAMWPGDVRGVEDLEAALGRQALAAYELETAAQELLTTPRVADCESRARALTARFLEGLEKLVPSPKAPVAAEEEAK
jgi:hypothetical protein